MKNTFACWMVFAHMALAGSTLTMFAGCARHQDRPMITAVGLSPGNRCDPPGIPYYLPKPLLVISKNVRHIDESKVGLTGPVPIPGGFDNQAAYADIKANVTVPSSAGGDGAAAAALKAVEVSGAGLSEASVGDHGGLSMAPEKMTPASADDFGDGLEVDSFFTYQVIFVPDLTQKYGLQITGGAGEFRAAMNMVNGWMYTGMGPFYFKDSSSAQNAMATGVAAMYAGRGVSDVIDSVGDLTRGIGAIGEGGDQREFETNEFNDAVRALAEASRLAPKVPRQLLNYAEIYIYEPVLLPEQTTEWRLIAEHHFDRDYLESVDTAEAAGARQRIIADLLSAAIVKGGAPPPAPQPTIAPQGAPRIEGGDVEEPLGTPRPRPRDDVFENRGDVFENGGDVFAYRDGTMPYEPSSIKLNPTGSSTPVVVQSPPAVGGVQLNGSGSNVQVNVLPEQPQEPHPFRHLRDKLHKSQPNLGGRAAIQRRLEDINVGSP